MCEDCGTLCGLYHRLHHMKQKLYVMCSEIVEKRKEDSPGIDTTQILNQLLADDVWLETVSVKYIQLNSKSHCTYFCSNSRRCKTCGQTLTALS